MVSVSFSLHLCFQLSQRINVNQQINYQNSKHFLQQLIPLL